MKLLVTTPAPGLTRRSFMAGAAATTLAASSGDILGAATGGPVIVTSWDFGPGANAVGWPIIEGGGLAIDAVEAAINFAVSKGFVETSLTSAASQAAWQAWMDEGGGSDAWDPEPIGQGAPPQGHDTVGCMAMDIHGNVCVGCSTNGRNFKLPGRVGDSPITGAGAYCDNGVGAAIATGDVMMRLLPTYHAVELMRAGAAPGEAAEAALQRITAKGYHFDGAVVALRKDGAAGAAKRGWVDEEFRYAVRDAAGAQHVLVT